MAEYHFYFIERNGHITRPAKVLECQGDEAAAREAEKLLNGRDIEIWEGARIVAYLVPERGSWPSPGPEVSATYGV